jgi:hypothetical protein
MPPMNTFLSELEPQSPHLKNQETIQAEQALKFFRNALRDFEIERVTVNSFFANGAEVSLSQIAHNPQQFVAGGVKAFGQIGVRVVSELHKGLLPR